MEILPLAQGGYNILLDNDEEYNFSNGTFVKIPSYPTRGFGTYLVYSTEKNGPSDYLFSELMEAKTIVTENSGNVSQEVKNSFHAEFGAHSAIHWNQTENFDVASFDVEGESVNAFFTKDGTLEGRTFLKKWTDLPFQAQVNIVQSYKDYDVESVFVYYGKSLNNSGNLFFADTVLSRDLVPRLSIRLHASLLSGNPIVDAARADDGGCWRPVYSGSVIASFAPRRPLGIYITSSRRTPSVDYPGARIAFVDFEPCCAIAGEAHFPLVRQLAMHQGTLDVAEADMGSRYTSLRFCRGVQAAVSAGQT